MEVLRELADTLRKMFVADLGLTLAALAVVGLTAALLHWHAGPTITAIALLPAGALAALLFGVWRGSRR